MREYLLTLCAAAAVTYLLTGPQLLSYADAAATLSKVLARPIVFHERTREEDKQEMVDVGVPAAIANMNAHAVSLIAAGDAACEQHRRESDAEADACHLSCDRTLGHEGVESPKR